MTSISMGLSGKPGAQRPEPPRPHPAAQAAQQQQAVDWGDAQHATPKPSPKVKVGRRVEPQTDVPQLPMRTVRVRAKPPATYYSADGNPIPADEWVDAVITPGLMRAIKEGDVEQSNVPGQAAPQHQRPHRHHPPQPLSAAVSDVGERNNG